MAGQESARGGGGGEVGREKETAHFSLMLISDGHLPLSSGTCSRSSLQTSTTRPSSAGRTCARCRCSATRGADGSCWGTRRRTRRSRSRRWRRAGSAAPGCGACRSGSRRGRLRLSSSWGCSRPLRAGRSFPVQGEAAGHAAPALSDGGQFRDRATAGKPILGRHSGEQARCGRAWRARRAGHARAGWKRVRSMNGAGVRRNGAGLVGWAGLEG